MTRTNIKSMPKLIRRFIGILLLSSILILLINVITCVVLIAHYATDTNASPYKIAQQTANDLHERPDGAYVLSENAATQLHTSGAWALLIDNSSRSVVWKTHNVPASIPYHYTLSDIATISTGYLDSYPTYVGAHDKGIVVLGFPRDSFWKHSQPSWNYRFISDFPQIILSILCINIVLILGIYIIANMKLLTSINPITKGIQRLSDGERVHIPETGALSEIAAHINSTSDILQQQKEQLRRKETARANWIAGVSHDIRTPLSMVMGYAGQLENSSHLLQEERNCAATIMAQSERMKNLINDLNLASKLEYNMQPLMKKEENVVAVVRHVVVDFMNMGLPSGFSITWDTKESLSVCTSIIDKELLQRAISNLIWNSIVHNEHGCTIYTSVCKDDTHCIIRVEDNGVGVSDEQLEILNHTPHYMICDTSTSEQRHGLGLLIVEQIVDAHSGSVEISKSEHGGFMTTLKLPLILPQ